MSTLYDKGSSGTDMNCTCSEVLSEYVHPIAIRVRRRQRDGTVVERRVRVWNATVANLTLMALGSSAPEILLSVIGVVGNNFEAGELGPGTIVGSAAYNLIVPAVCIISTGARSSPLTYDPRNSQLNVFIFYLNVVVIFETQVFIYFNNLILVFQNNSSHFTQNRVKCFYFYMTVSYKDYVSIVYVHLQRCLQSDQMFGVFVVKSVWAIFAYIWLYIIITFTSPSRSTSGKCAPLP